MAISINTIDDWDSFDVTDAKSVFDDWEETLRYDGFDPKRFSDVLTRALTVNYPRVLERRRTLILLIQLSLSKGNLLSIEDSKKLRLKDSSKSSELKSIWQKLDIKVKAVNGDTITLPRISVVCPFQASMILKTCPALIKTHDYIGPLPDYLCHISAITIIPSTDVNLRQEWLRWYELMNKNINSGKSSLEYQRCIDRTSGILKVLTTSNLYTDSDRIKMMNKLA